MSIKKNTFIPDSNVNIASSATNKQDKNYKHICTSTVVANKNPTQFNSCIREINHNKIFK